MDGGIFDCRFRGYISILTIVLTQIGRSWGVGIGFRGERSRPWLKGRVVFVFYFFPENSFYFWRLLRHIPVTPPVRRPRPGSRIRQTFQAPQLCDLLNTLACLPLRNRINRRFVHIGMGLSTDKVRHKRCSDAYGDGGSLPPVLFLHFY